MELNVCWDERQPDKTSPKYEERMRTLPEDDSDRANLARLNAEPWMIEYLKLNPAYVHWGPGEDYMSTKGESWATSQEVSGWSAFGPWKLDEMNECVHFYFELERPSEKCASCDGSGYNSETKVIADTFYDHGDYSLDFENWRIVGSIESARKPGGASGRRWHDKITQDEVDALVTAGRLRKWTENGWQTVPRAAAEVNAANAEGAKHDHELDHDGINRGILIKTRAKRLGVWGLCPRCEGSGTVFTAPHGHLNVVLWILHPRKGCSRGVRVQRLSEVEAEAAKRWLSRAAERNVQRFEKVTDTATSAVDNAVGTLADQLEEHARGYSASVRDNWNNIPDSQREPEALVFAAFKAGASMARVSIETRAKNCRACRHKS